MPTAQCEDELPSKERASKRVTKYQENQMFIESKSSRKASR
jgi:hypothetical protein